MLDRQIIPGATAGIYSMLIVGILPEAGKTSVARILHRKMPNSGQSWVEKKADRARQYTLEP